MGAGRFGKVLTAMVTPFKQDGSLDVDGVATLARWLVAHGSDGLVLTGTTGEAPTLTDDETVTVWETARAAVDVPLLAGTGWNDTRHTITLSERAAATGVDGLLVVVPYYNRPPQEGLDLHMRAVAEATDLPVVLYDVPTRTGRSMTVETIVRLAQEVPTIVGIKDARGNLAESARIVAEAPGDFDLYSGDDPLTLPLMAVGGVGIVSVAANWSGTLFAEMVAAFEKRDDDTARAVNARLMPSYAYEMTDLWQHATGAKALLGELGLPSGPCRAPLPPYAPEAAREQARDIITTLELRQ